MIILSAGLEKSGTGWYFNLTNDLLVAAGYRNVRLVREKYHLQGILREFNCNVGQPTFFKLTQLLLPHLFGNAFAVKTHGSPSSKFLHYLMHFGILKATYIFRDPRDIAISAFEHGEKIRANHQMHTFGILDSIEASILFVKSRLKIWGQWEECRQAYSNHMLFVKYEDLVADPLKESRRLVDFLEIDVSSKILLEIEKRYAIDSSGRDLKGLHFNKGVAGRFRRVMNQKELDLCLEHFGGYLQRMGYPP